MIIDNTNTEAWEMKPYVLIVRIFVYSLIFNHFFTLVYLYVNPRRDVVHLLFLLYKIRL